MAPAFLPQTAITCNCLENLCLQIYSLVDGQLGDTLSYVVGFGPKGRPQQPYHTYARDAGPCPYFGMIAQSLSLERIGTVTSCFVNPCTQVFSLVGGQLGDSLSYVIGIGPKGWPQQPYHRQASCPADGISPCNPTTALLISTGNPHQLTGRLVGCISLSHMAENPCAHVGSYGAFHEGGSPAWQVWGVV